MSEGAQVSTLGKCYICGKYTQVSKFGYWLYCDQDYPKPQEPKKPKYVYVPRQHTVIEATCPVCGEKFEKNQNNGKKYCSTDCSLLAQKLGSDRGRFIIFERDDFRCFYCGTRSYNNNIELHVDHVISRKHGGKSVAWNLVTACQPCNLSKHTLEIRNVDDVLEEVSRRNKAANIPGELTIKLGHGDNDASDLN